MSAIVNFNQNEGLFVIASVYCKKKGCKYRTGSKKVLQNKNRL